MKKRVYIKLWIYHIFANYDNQLKYLSFLFVLRLLSSQFQNFRMFLAGHHTPSSCFTMKIEDN